MPSPNHDPAWRWLGLVRAAAVVCPLLLLWLIGVLPRTAGVPLQYQDWMGHLPFYPLLTVPYWISWWWLRSKTPSSLAWAVGTGLGGFLFLAPFVPLALNHYEQPAWWLAIIFSGLLLLTEVTLFAGAAITYSKIARGHRAQRPLILGVAATASCFFVAVVSLIPPLHIHKRQHANEAIAVGTLRELSRALEAYKGKCPGYPTSLTALLPPHGGQSPNCLPAETIEEGSPLIWLALGGEAAPVRGGYRFSYGSSGPMVSQQPRGHFYLHYQINADPLRRGRTGFRSFWVSDKGEILVNWDAAAGPADLPLD